MKSERSPITSDLPAAPLSELDEGISQFRNLSVAEDIALLRIDLEPCMVKPPEQWMGELDRLIHNYPTAKPYKIFFERSIGRALVGRGHMDKMWHDFHSESNVESKRTGEGVVEKAHPEVAPQLFTGIFRTDPKGEVDVYKGSVAMRFMVDDETYRSIKGLPQGEIASGAYVTEFSGISFPLMVLRSNIPEDAVIPVRMHETEHVKQRITKRGNRIIFFERIMNENSIPPKAFYRLNKDGGMNGEGKQEILAYFSRVGMIDVANSDRHKIQKFVDLYKEQIKELLLDGDGEYYPKYIQRYAHFSAGIDAFKAGKITTAYEKDVRKGVEAVCDLFNLYLDLGYSQKSALLAINVLDQFPLSSWEGVVKLLRKKHLNNAGSGKLEESE